MFTLLVTISPLLILLAPATESVKTADTNTKAASPYTNCGCQCSNLTFRDKYGKTQGNCKSADHTGAQWCYVDPNQSSSCQDLSYTSVRFPGKPWSYEACATPACGNNNGGYNNGGYNSGSNGGYNSGSNGGYNSGSNGGYNSGSNGGYNSGSNGYTSGSSTCRGTKCLSGSGSNGYNTGSYGSGSNGYNSGSNGYNSGSNGYNSGSYGSGSSSNGGQGYLGGILAGRSKTAESDSVKFGR
eukprot:GFUD01008438.1.p1 GENE.GFUD01008438.1~~GFUD01008438.1.p1  ORF type:complete len:241 (-),score=59.43 GFUD01008438.1:182-904(-)